MKYPAREGNMLLPTYWKGTGRYRMTKTSIGGIKNSTVKKVRGGCRGGRVLEDLGKPADSRDPATI